MKNSIPITPLLLSLAGLLPFVWGMLTRVSSPLMMWSELWLGNGLTGTNVQLTYGTVIMCFMSGVLWGFATKTKQTQAIICYSLSILPALGVFFLVSSNTENKLTFLMLGFVVLFFIDFLFSKLSLTPSWWLRLRGGLTGLVLFCLAAPHITF